MAKESKWWSFPCVADNGRTIITTGRDDVDKFRKSGKYRFRVDISWDYDSLPDGMPDEQSSQMLEAVTEAFTKELNADNAAVMTGIYTGDGTRDWVFYTLNLRIFNNILNRALADLPLLPLRIEASEDPEWEEYEHLKDTTYIPDEER